MKMYVGAFAIALGILLAAVLIPRAELHCPLTYPIKECP